MSDNKHIDRIFQENFKDFEATPGDAVWNNIEAKLKKKKRRIMPIWWRYAGIAALLLLFLSVGGVYWSNSGSNSNLQIVDTDNTLVIDTNNTDNGSSSQTKDTESPTKSSILITTTNESPLSEPVRVAGKSNSNVAIETRVSKSSHKSKTGPMEKDRFEQSMASKKSADKNTNVVAT